MTAQLGMFCLNPQEGQDFVLKSLALMSESLGCEQQKWLPKTLNNLGFVDVLIIFFQRPRFKVTYRDRELGKFSRQYVSNTSPQEGLQDRWSSQSGKVQCHFVKPEYWLQSSHIENGLVLPNWFFPQTVAISKFLGNCLLLNLSRKNADFWNYYSEEMKKKLMCITSGI